MEAGEAILSIRLVPKLRTLPLYLRGLIKGVRVERLLRIPDLFEIVVACGRDWSFVRVLVQPDIMGVEVVYVPNLIGSPLSPINLSLSLCFVRVEWTGLG